MKPFHLKVIYQPKGKAGEYSQWLDDFLKINKPTKYLSISFTLTGHDDLELGATTNQERIEAMKKLHNAGFKTWASIELIELDDSYKMIRYIENDCDLFKIGIQSGAKWHPSYLKDFITDVLDTIHVTPIYFKDSLLQQAGITRKELPSNCVTRDFNL